MTRVSCLRLLQYKKPAPVPSPSPSPNLFSPIMGYYADSDSSEGSTDWASFLASFSELAEAHPPYTAGTLPLPSTAFDLYYKDANDGSQ